MARIFGFVSNRPELGAKLLAKYSEVLRVESDSGKPLGWGVGFYQSGEVLLRRRPLDDRGVIDIGEVTDQVETDILIGHVRQPTVGNLRTENTHPFRYRQWLFAQTGTIGGFSALRERLLESQPEFLRKNVRGDTDAEVFFYLFLSFLHDAGHLNELHTSAEHIIKALRSSFALVERLGEAPAVDPIGDILVTNGEFLVALHRSGVMAQRYMKGGREIEHLLTDSVTGGPRAANLAATRCSVIAGALEKVPEGWEPSPTNSFITLARTEEPVSEPL